MKSTPLRLVVLLTIVCVLCFSGQRRPAPQKPAPAKEQPPEPTVERTVPLREVPLLALRPGDIRFPPQDGRNVAPRTVVLLGDPRTANLYVTRTLIPERKQILPHVHADSRTVVVLSGTYYYAVGETFDASKLVAFPPGSFLTEPAGVPHYTWAKDGDVVIQTTAIGPSGTRVLPDKP